MNNTVFTSMSPSQSNDVTVAVDFNPRMSRRKPTGVAERRLNRKDRRIEIKRRSATRGIFVFAFRGLKPPATFRTPLRGETKP